MTRPRLAPGLELNEVSDGLVVLDTDGGMVHYLNSTAAMVLALCDGTNLPADIVEREHRAVPPDEAADDQLERCLAELATKGLVR